MNVIQHSDICTGCGSCAAVCPFAAIRMLPDGQGFLYPSVDPAACTACGLCARRCPVSSLPQISTHTELLTGYANDEALLFASSSGAIFPVLAAEIIRRGGIVFGAAFNQEFDVVHAAAENAAELAALCGSKYVQSSISAELYAQVKATLTAGRWVYFSAMPCQVAGLKSYLGRDYDTLITQDTVCHSVPSPMVWKSYHAELEAQNGCKLKSFSFRRKATGWENYHIYATFESGKEFSQPAAENPYQRGFIKGLYSRSSCFTCKFKGIERCSDLTLADYWGVRSIQPEAYHPQGTSLIMLHSEKGRALLESCKDRLQTRPAAEDALTWNTAALRPIQKPARYEEFWAAYGKKPFAQLVSDCCEPTKKEAAKERWNRSLLARVIHRLTK